MGHRPPPTVVLSVLVAALVACDRATVSEQDAPCERCVTSSAATGSAGFLDGPADSAQLDQPRGLCFGLDGELIIADSNNHRIRALDSEGNLTTLAGSGTSAFQDGPVDAAAFREPSDVALGPDGTIYVADTFNHRIRAIADGLVTTVAGGGRGGRDEGRFADGPVKEARFNAPAGVSVDDQGRIYVADSRNHRVRVIEDGEVYTLAGGGPDQPADSRRAEYAAGEVQLYTPRDVVVHGAELLVVDTNNNRVRLISGGTITTLAGEQCSTDCFADGDFAAARFSFPTAIAISANGSMVLADNLNHRIRRLVGGKVTTLAGTGKPGHRDGGLDEALFNSPQGIAVDGRRAYVSDTLNHRIRSVWFY